MNGSPHFSQLLHLLIVATLSAARKCQHVHFISKMEDKKGAILSQNPDNPSTQFLNLGSESQSTKIYFTAQLLDF